jgi:small subunit ribosomal protein S6
MALYELVLIMGKNLAVEEVDKNIDKISSDLKENGGELISKEYWGLKRLASKIKKYNYGHYSLLNIDCSVKARNELERLIKINENIVRNIFFKLDKKPTTPSRLAVSDSAKNYKSGKSIYQKTEVDDFIEKLVINQ